MTVVGCSYGILSPFFSSLPADLHAALRRIRPPKAENIMLRLLALK